MSTKTDSESNNSDNAQQITHETNFLVNGETNQIDSDTGHDPGSKHNHDISRNITNLNVTEEMSKLQLQIDNDDIECGRNSNGSENLSTEQSIDYVVYKSELQMKNIMCLITKDLSEPYSIYTYRYFIHNWPKLCFLVSNHLSLAFTDV